MIDDEMGNLWYFILREIEIMVYSTMWCNNSLHLDLGNNTYPLSNRRSLTESCVDVGIGVGIGVGIDNLSPAALWQFRSLLDYVRANLLGQRHEFRLAKDQPVEIGFATDNPA